MNAKTLAICLVSAACFCLGLGGRGQPEEPTSRPSAAADHAGLWERHTNAGTRALDQGRYAEAEQHFSAAVKEARQFGDRDERLATSLKSLAEAHRAMGNYAKAEPLYQQALKIDREVLGENHPGYSTDLDNLAGLYVRMGDYAKAEPLYQQALEIKGKVLGKEHPSYAIGLNNLAWLYSWMGDYARAEPFYRQALAIFEKALGPEHPQVAQNLGNLAHLLREMRRDTEAEKMGARERAIRVRRSGKTTNDSGRRPASRPSRPPPVKEQIEAARKVGVKPLIEIDVGGGVKMTMMLIPAGTFTMGSPATHTDREDDETQHEVTLTKPFYMGVTEVTQAQWQAVMDTRPWEGKRDAKVNPAHAANYISWNDCQVFLRRLNTKVTGAGFRLPTEAEWEYACRAGSTTRFHYGDDWDYSQLGRYAWYYFNAYDKRQWYAHEVGAKQANRWGLYDMYGNVWEWCQDWHGDHPRGRVTDPTGLRTGRWRVLRGGSWEAAAWSCRSASRIKDVPTDPYTTPAGSVALGPSLPLER